MKAVVLGYHEIGYVCLEELLGSRIAVSALFTHKDAPDETIWFRTPRILAEQHRIPVYEPESLTGSGMGRAHKGLRARLPFLLLLPAHASKGNP